MAGPGLSSQLDFATLLDPNFFPRAHKFCRFQAELFFLPPVT
jgi:hypothetical protein